MIKVRKPSLPVHSVVDDIKHKYVLFKKSMKRIESAQQDAFDRMYEFGEQLLEHDELIKKQFGTYGYFAEKHGMDRSVLSRCRASVADFKMHGCHNLKQARTLLENRGFTPSAKLMESNINRLLIDAENHNDKEPPKGNSVKRQKHTKELQQLEQRIQEIVENHDNDDELYQQASHLEGFIHDSLIYLNSLDISQKKWSSNLYLDFCRNINYDVVLGHPVASTEPHHIAPDGSQGSQGGKVADLFAIPVCRDTHEKLHNQDIVLTYEEISDMHRWTMTMFILNTIASD